MGDRMKKRASDKIFEREDNVVQKSQDILKSEPNYYMLKREFLLLSGEYTRLLSQLKKLIRISDISQKELYKTREELQNQYDYIDDQLSIAVKHVRSLLPSPYSDKSIEIDWKYVPVSKLAGDIFGYHFLDNQNMAIYLIDVSGHGIGPALHSVSILNTIKTQSLPSTNFYDPAEVVTTLNNTFDMFANNDLYFTMWYCVLNLETYELNYCAGGHPPMIMINNNSDLTLIDSINPPVGASPFFKFKSLKLQLPENSSFYLYTDGIYEIELEKGVFHNLELYYKKFLEMYQESDNLLEDVYQYAKGKCMRESLDDDFTIIEIKTKELNNI